MVTAGRIRKQKLAKYLRIQCTRGSVSSQILQMYFIIMQWFNGICFSLPEITCFPVQAWDLNIFLLLQWYSAFLTAGSPSEHIHTTWAYTSLFKTQDSSIQQTIMRNFRGHSASSQLSTLLSSLSEESCSLRVYTFLQNLKKMAAAP